MNVGVHVCIWLCVGATSMHFHANQLVLLCLRCCCACCTVLQAALPNPICAALWQRVWQPQPLPPPQRRSCARAHNRPWQRAGRRRCAQPPHIRNRDGVACADAWHRGVDCAGRCVDRQGQQQPGPCSRTWGAHPHTLRHPVGHRAWGHCQLVSHQPSGDGSKGVEPEQQGGSGGGGGAVSGSGSSGQRPRCALSTSSARSTDCCWQQGACWCCWGAGGGGCWGAGEWACCHWGPGDSNHKGGAVGA